MTSDRNFGSMIQGSFSIIGMYDPHKLCITCTLSRRTILKEQVETLREKERRKREEHYMFFFSQTEREKERERESVVLEVQRRRSNSQCISLMTECPLSERCCYTMQT